MKHGTLTAYFKYGCRCSACRREVADRQRERVANRRGKPVPDFVEHGKPTTYSNWACRCESCTAAWREACALLKERRQQRLLADPSAATHGTASTYHNWGCRCAPCRTAYAASRKARTR